MHTPSIHWLHEVGRGHDDLVGKKCANLGEMTRLGMRVPPGFAIGVDAYREYMERTGLAGRISEYFAAIGDGLRRGFAKQLEASRCAQEMIRSEAIPAELGEEIERAYEALCARCETADVAVAVRSSGAVSMPGQMDTHLHVRGSAAVKRRVVDVWESAFNARAIAFRLERGIPADRVQLGVAVVKMVDAKSAGVVLTFDPLTGDTDRVVIEGNWGLGESVVSGEMTPDQFIVMKDTAIIDRKIQRKTRWVVPTRDGTARVDVPPEMQDAPCLNDDEVRELASGAIGAERHFGVAQDMEWAVDRGLPFPQNVFWVQARPARYTPRREGSETDYLVEQMATLFRR